MRYFAILVLFAACGCSEQPANDEVRAESGEGHIFQAQQDALEKTREAAAALEAATHRIEQLVPPE